MSSELDETNTYHPLSAILLRTSLLLHFLNNDLFSNVRVGHGPFFRMGATVRHLLLVTRTGLTLSVCSFFDRLRDVSMSVDLSNKSHSIINIRTQHGEKASAFLQQQVLQTECNVLGDTANLTKMLVAIFQ